MLVIFLPSLLTDLISTLLRSATPACTSIAFRAALALLGSRAIALTPDFCRNSL